MYQPMVPFTTKPPHIIIITKLFIIAVMVLMYGQSLCAAPSSLQPAVLKSVAHHTSSSDTNAKYLDVGTVFFGFSTMVNPQVVAKKELPDGYQEYQLLFPRVRMSPEAMRAIKEINERRSSWYMLYVQEDEKGIICTIRYPKNQIGFQYELIKTGSAPRIVLRFINRAIQQQITQNVEEKGIIVTAWNSAAPHVMIDPGHGGADPGAIGTNQVREKDLCLALSHTIVRQLQTLGIAASLTRPDDSTYPLDARTAAVYARGADLLVSVHANAAHNASAHGVETFYDDGAHTCPLFSTVATYNHYKNLDKQLAHAVHTHMLDAVVNSNPGVIDRGLKTAPLQLLMASPVPAILVEIGFLSNAQESALLATTQYQTTIAQAIAAGIAHYCKNSV